MGVKILIPPFLEAVVGQKAVEVNGQTVGKCLIELFIKFPGAQHLVLDEKGQLLHYLDIYVNGRDIRSQGLQSPVSQGDEIFILFIISGG
jgi:molybdopterin converting factor small subunit